MAEKNRNKSEGQRKRAQTPEGQAHLEKIRAKAHATRRAQRIVTEEFRLWNDRMRKHGIPTEERYAAIQKAKTEAARSTAQHDTR